jgi:hypothetical protein
MKTVVIREELIKVASIVGGIALGALLITGYSFYDRQNREDTLAQVENDLALAKNQIVKLEEDNDKFLQLQLHYNRIPDKQRDINLSDLPSRLAILQPALQNLKVRYRLAVLDISLTNVAPLVGTQEQKGYITHFNTITLTFGGLSDELMMSFLQELFETLPGYIRVEKLVMNRKIEISPAVLAQIQNSSIPVLVEGSVVFTWKTVRKQ